MRDASQVATLLDTLDESAIRLKSKTSKLTRQQLEDIRDGEAAMRSLEEMQRTGVSYTVDELRKKFGLL